MNGQEYRICSDCEEKKVLSGYVFYKLKTFDKKKIFDDVCIQCRKKANSRNQNMKRKKTKGILDQCRNRNCSNEILRVGFKHFCSDECRMSENKMIKLDRSEESKQQIKKAIDPKFLVRGPIYGVHYV